MGHFYLGAYDTKNKKILIIKENIVKAVTGRMEGIKIIKPENFKEIENKYPSLIPIWGDESIDDLYKKITSQETDDLKKSIALLIYSTLNTYDKEKVKACFKLLKNSNKDLYNSFGNEFLNTIGLSISKGWKFW